LTTFFASCLPRTSAFNDILKRSLIIIWRQGRLLLGRLGLRLQFATGLALLGLLDVVLLCHAALGACGTFQGALAVLGQSGEYLIYSDRELKPIPRLAESWEPNEDGSQWTFKIRQGVKFHNGKALTAEDVAATFNLHANPDTGGNALSAFRGVLSGGGAQATDESTVVFELDAPNGNFPFTTSSDNYNMIILPKGFDTTTWPKNFMGTGPWVLDKYTPNVGVTYAKNPDYWDQERQPLPDRHEITFYEDEEAGILGIQGDEVDLLAQFSPVNGEALLTDHVRIGDLVIGEGQLVHAPLTKVGEGQAHGPALGLVGKVAHPGPLLGVHGEPAGNVLQSEALHAGGIEEPPGVLRTAQNRGRRGGILPGLGVRLVLRQGHPLGLGEGDVAGVQVRQLADLARVHRAAFALLGRGSAGEPHEVVSDQLSAPFERVEQGERPVGSDQLEVGGAARGDELHHRLAVGDERDGEALFNGGIDHRQQLAGTTPVGRITEMSVGEMKRNSRGASDLDALLVGLQRPCPVVAVVWSEVAAMLGDHNGRERPGVAGYAGIHLHFLTVYLQFFPERWHFSYLQNLKNVVWVSCTCILS
jgi:hypothetical protein